METTIYFLGSRVKNKNHIEQQIGNEIQSSVLWFRVQGREWKVK